jgi:hypothetical protein
MGRGLVTAEAGEGTGEETALSWSLRKMVGADCMAGVDLN